MSIVFVAKRGVREYAVVEKIIGKELHYAVNWTERDRQGVIGGLYPSVDAAVAAIEPPEASAR